MAADAQAVGRLPDRAEIDRQAVPVGFERGVREIGAGGHAQHRECGPHGQAGRDAQGIGNRLRRQVRALAQLQMAGDVGDADPELQVWAELIADRGLDIDRADDGVVAEEPAREVGAIPLGFEAIRRVQPNPRRHLRAEGMRDVNVWNGDEGVLEVAAGAQEVVGKASLCPNQGNPGADVGAGQPGQARGTKVDGGAVGAGPRGGDPGAAHGARVVLVDAKTLPSEAGGEREGGDKRGSSTGEQQRRKPPHW